MLYNLYQCCLDFSANGTETLTEPAEEKKENDGTIYVNASTSLYPALCSNNEIILLSSVAVPATGDILICYIEKVFLTLCNIDEVFLALCDINKVFLTLRDVG